MKIINENLFLETLVELNPSLFETLLDFCNIASGIIPGPLRPQKERAKALIFYFQDSFTSLDKLYENTYKVIPLSVIKEEEKEKDDYDYDPDI